MQSKWISLGIIYYQIQQDLNSVIPAVINTSGVKYFRCKVLHLKISQKHHYLSWPNFGLIKSIYHFSQ